MKTNPTDIRALQKPKTAVGTAEPCPVVLVEVSGALGALFAQRRCPDETLEEVLYFRILMDEPYAKFLRCIELITVDGYSVAYAKEEQGILYEPSRMAYEIRNISGELYGQFVDHITAHDFRWAEERLNGLFCKSQGFSVSPTGKLTGPEDYARGFDHFLGNYSFIEPGQSKKR